MFENNLPDAAHHEAVCAGFGDRDKGALERERKFVFSHFECSSCEHLLYVCFMFTVNHLKDGRKLLSIYARQNLYFVMAEYWNFCRSPFLWNLRGVGRREEEEGGKKLLLDQRFACYWANGTGGEVIVSMLKAQAGFVKTTIRGVFFRAWKVTMYCSKAFRCFFSGFTKSLFSLVSYRFIQDQNWSI